VTDPTDQPPYAELPAVSGGYPPPRGRLPTCYAPVRHVSSPKATPSDLHALGTPPALILSQDQTLHQDLCTHLEGRVLMCFLNMAGDIAPAISRILCLMRRHRGSHSERWATIRCAARSVFGRRPTVRRLTATHTAPLPACQCARFPTKPDVTTGTRTATAVLATNVLILPQGVPLFTQSPRSVTQLLGFCQEDRRF
jgi:hypothetical protein